MFWGGASQDYVCLIALARPTVEQRCKNLTYKEYDADHWLTLSHADQINKDVQEWIEGIVVSGSKL